MPEKYKRPSYTQAKQVLDKWCSALDGKSPSTNKTVTKDMNAAARSLEWWLQNMDTVPPHDSPRSIAYLRAYADIGEQIFFATGIPLSDGYLQPDRAVMKAMLLAQCVTLNQEKHYKFEITTKGRTLIDGSLNEAQP